MINQPALLPLVELNLAGVSTVALASFLFAYYFKARFLPARRQPALAEVRDPRRMDRVNYPSALQLQDPAGRFSGEPAQLLNLSLGGLSFSSSRRLGDGERICLRLPAAGKRFLHIIGHIVWTRPDAQESTYGLKIHTTTENL